MSMVSCTDWALSLNALTSGEPTGVWISDFDPKPDSIDLSVLWVGVLGGGGGGVHWKLNRKYVNITYFVMAWTILWKHILITGN